MNLPPVLTGIIITRGTTSMPAAQPLFAGQVVSFSAEVLDPEGGPLTFEWSTVSGDGGVFSDPMLERPTWYSPEVTQSYDSAGSPFPSWTVRVSVSDGTNVVTSELPVAVRAPYFSNILNDSVIGSTAFAGCSNSSCHGSTSTHVSGFNINRFNATATHTALRAMHNKGTSCSIATNRITPFNPTGSLLYRKLLGGVPTACGAQMPLGRGPVAPNELVTIRSWINAGAQNN